MKNRYCSSFASRAAMLVMFVCVTAVLPVAADPALIFSETWRTRSSVLQITNGMMLTPEAHNTDNAWHAILLNPQNPQWNLLGSSSDSWLKTGSSRSVRCDASFLSSLPVLLVQDDWSSFTLKWRIRFSDSGGTVEVSRLFFYLAADGGTTTSEAGVATVPQNGFGIYQNLPQSAYTTFGGFMVADQDVLTSTPIGNVAPERAKTYDWTAVFSPDGENTRVEYSVLSNASPFLSGVVMVEGRLSSETMLNRIVIRGEDCARVRIDRIDNIQVEGIYMGPELAHDAGEEIIFPSIGLHRGETSQETTFTIRNAGSGNLTISSLETNPASVFHVVFPTEAFVLGPDESQEVTLRFEEAIPGLYTGTLTILSDALFSPSVVIDLSGSVGMPVLSHDAGSTITFPLLDLELGQSASDTTFTILNTGNADLTVSLTADPSPRFDVIFPTDALVISASSSAEIVLRFTETTAGDYSGVLTVESDDLTSPVIHIGLFGTVVGAPNIEHDAGTTITFAPIDLDLGESAKDATFTIQNTGAAALTITSLAAAPSRFSVVSPVGGFVVEPGGSRLVTLRFSETTAGAYTGALTIHSNDPDSPSVEIGLSGSAVQGPPSLILKQPNGGNNWQAGARYYITWDASSAVGTHVKIELWKGHLLVSPPIAASTANTGSFAWNIPWTMRAGSDYKVRISSIADPSIFDESDGFFRISPDPDSASARNWTDYR